MRELSNLGGQVQNVTAANHVFHFTRAWNPAKEAQATDRAYRIGATKDVYVYCPTVVASDFKTFEVRLDELLKKKSALAGATLDDGGLNAMLNGTGSDASFAELVGDGGPGESLPQRHLTMDDVDRMDVLEAGVLDVHGAFLLFEVKLESKATRFKPGGYC